MSETTLGLPLGMPHFLTQHTPYTLSYLAAVYLELDKYKRERHCNLPLLSSTLGTSHRFASQWDELVDLKKMGRTDNYPRGSRANPSSGSGTWPQFDVDTTVTPPLLVIHTLLN